MTEIVEYSATEAALSELAGKYKGVLFDCTTREGMATAVDGRAELRGLRVALDKTRKEIKEPALRRTQLIDSEARRITAALEALENPIDAQIKKEQERKEFLRTAAIRAEQERLAAEERAKKEAEERQLAEARAKLEAEQAEFARQQAAQREAEEKARREREEQDRQARAKIEAEERAARERREEEDRQARAAREEEDRKAKEQQERNQAAISEVQGIQQQVIIAQIGRLGVRAGGTIACIEETLAETEAWEIEAERFGMFTEAAFKAKETAVAQIKALLAAAVARAAEDDAMKAERERLEVARRTAEEEERRVRVAKELKEAAERRAVEERDRAERDREEAEARAKAEEERKAREAEEARQREIQRQENETGDFRKMCATMKARFGHRKDAAPIIKAIDKYLGAKQASEAVAS